MTDLADCASIPLVPVVWPTSRPQLAAHERRLIAPHLVCMDGPFDCVQFSYALVWVK